MGLLIGGRELQLLRVVNLLDPLLDGFGARPIETDLAGRDFAQARDVGSVRTLDEQGRALHDLTSASRRENDEGEAIVLAFETVFYGYTGHLAFLLIEPEKGSDYGVLRDDSGEAVMNRLFDRHSDPRPDDQPAAVQPVGDRVTL
jgi:hypothetical protein